MITLEKLCLFCGCKKPIDGTCQGCIILIEGEPIDDTVFIVKRKAKE